MNKNKSLFIVLLLLASLTACGGGGGGYDSGNTPDGVDSSAGQWKVSADVTHDGCGDRISDVNQTFAVSDSGGAITVNSGIVTVNGTKTDSGFTSGFSETNGSCNRSYTADFAYTSGTTATVNLVSNSDCGTVVCQNNWAGTATKVN